MGTIDLGSYVDVGDQQALAIEQVDFIWQRDGDYGTCTSVYLTGNGALTSQLTDLNPSTVFVRADDNSLIASGSLNVEDNALGNVSSHASDFFPDNFGKLDESRMVVNDQLYFVVGVDGSDVDAGIMYGTVRIKARIVKLSTKDWMAIAIQSTAADN